MAMVKTLSQYWLRIQSSLFPWLEEELGELTEKEQKIVTTEVIPKTGYNGELIAPIYLSG